LAAAKGRDAAKRMGLTLLYKYGYDYASRYVHPMANDGQDDFYTITHLEPEVSDAGIVVLSNSILIASMILQEALNSSSLCWRAVVYNAIEGIRDFLLSAAPEHHLPLAKVSMMFTEKVPLEQRRDPSPVVPPKN
jgi:hypothetical protein